MTQTDRQFGWHAGLVCLALVLPAAGCYEAGDFVYGEQVEDRPLQLQSERVGIFPDRSVLDDPNNPFRYSWPTATSKWEIESAAGNVVAFYSWATVLAYEPTGEAQYYTALNLEQVYKNGQAVQEDLDAVKALAVAGYQSVLDNFPDAQSFDASGTVAFDLVTLSYLAIVALGETPTGESDYASQESFAAVADAGGDGGGGLLSGPDPFEEGDERLAIGAFYEGGSSIEVPIDELTTHLYVYEQTLSLQLDPERVEGRESMRISHGGGLWCGMGVHWDGGRPLTAWTALHLSARSSDAAFADFEIGMNDASGTSKVKVSDYGFRGDGGWHTMTIPLADFEAAGLDLSSVQAPFVFLGGPGAAGSAVLIDAVYLTAD